jgi:hypothetical protein
MYLKLNNGTHNYPSIKTGENRENYDNSVGHTNCFVVKVKMR